MKILVCVKQVPESDSKLRINDSERWIHDDPAMSHRMNLFDEFAVEEALLIREAFSNTAIDIISVGPERSAIVVRRALGMGADHGIHIVTDHSGYMDPYITASCIASWARDKGHDLILTGVMAEDDMQSQVGGLIAEVLSLPCASSCVHEQITPDKGTIYVEREIEGGYRDCLELSLPAVLTIQSGINTPRYPSLSNLLRAKKQNLESIALASLEPPEPQQDVIRVAYPQKARAGKVLEGTEQEKAARLLEILLEKSLIR